MPQRNNDMVIGREDKIITIDDSDDEEQDAADLAATNAQEAQLQQRREEIEQRAQKRRKADDGLTFTFVLSPSRLEKLDQIKDPADERLQQLLWELGFDFTLYEHQHKGARVVAGVSDDFPGAEMLLVEGEGHRKKRKARLLALRNAQPRQESADHGVLMADDMGLGKTVQTGAAIRLRNAIASAKGEPRKPTLICSPTDGVLKQWREHLLKAGVDRNKIVVLKPRQESTLERKDSVFLCTVHGFQSEAKYIFESLPPSKKNNQSVETVQKHKSSPLFPSASEELLRVLYNQYQHSHGKAKNKYNDNDNDGWRGRGGKLSNNMVVTQRLKKAEKEMTGGRSRIFRMVVVDEAVSLQ